ncbi:GNAT family N-acetyltransferase [Paenibacillus hexagrammi]|uniref:GNAT family N-acetyltransferase n=1 Tax=Paenibacillus hexagrammi TaxID=2908839 RepID=A0ABY3SDX5_9BACL|nr:GNAT family protein [Paenibacillus sp. YPD9-1]UJF32126.1 GNAT family N-acetyltransferase [Paenibacillus sp. YPD9-1]
MNLNMELKPTTLQGERVALIPMNASHIDGLAEAAHDPAIWGYMKPLLNRAEVEAFVRLALEEQQAGLSLPFSVYDKQTEQWIGSTRLHDYSASNRHLEIGHTWYHPSVWRTRVNTECKYLLLRHCFETLDLIRVQIKTDLRNVRSQEAIARLGAQREGILRQHRILHDGYIRDTVMFSILDSEWHSVRNRLEGFLNKNFDLAK